MGGSLQTFFQYQRLLDFFCCVVTWLLSYYIRFVSLPGGQSGLLNQFPLIAPLLGFVTVFTFTEVGLYRSVRFPNRYQEIFKVYVGNLYAIGLLVIFIYFLSEEKVSRLTLIFYFFLSGTTLALLRMGMRNLLRWFRKKGKYWRNFVLVGDAPELDDYIKMTRFYKDSGIRFMMWAGGPENNEHEIPICPLTDLDKHLKPSKVENVVLSFQPSKVSHALEIIKNYENRNIHFQFLPHMKSTLLGHQIEDFGGIALINVNSPPMPWPELMAKRMLDIVGSGLGMILISPLLILLALLVKRSSPGPIFFGQERMGIDGRTFTMWKFRTMKVAKSKVTETEWSNQENPRKTPFGDFLRRASLDELPQLWNVFLGEMSLVGPRPERPFFVEKFKQEIPGYMLRHKMRAGITGWAQINGWRGDTSLHKRIECDLYYIKNFSIWLDLKILIMTFFKGMVHKNAY